MTTICGLGMMYFADFGKYRNSGPAIAIVAGRRPAGLHHAGPGTGAGRRQTRSSGPAAFRSARPPAGSDSADAGRLGGGARWPEPLHRRWVGFWDWASRVIIAYPGWILVASVLVLLPPAYEGTSVPVTYDLLNELQADRPSVVGTKMALRHFSAGEMTPLTILAVEEDGQFNESAGEKHIAQLTKTLYDVDGVVSVRSIAEPLGDPPGYFQPFSAEGLAKAGRPQAQADQGDLSDPGSGAGRQGRPVRRGAEVRAVFAAGGRSA